MIVQDLIEYLSELNPEAEVRIAYQPNWPMWEAVTAIQAGTEGAEPVNEAGLCLQCSDSLDAHDDSECEDGEVVTPEDAPAVYVIGGGSNHYATKALWGEDAW